MKVLLCFVVVALVAAVHGANVSKISEESLDETWTLSEIKQYTFRLLKKAGLIDANGEFQVETIKTTFKENLKDPEKVDDLVAKCAVKKDTPQNSAFEFFQCMQQNTLVKSKTH
ncbi:hypothetical protein MTP99_003275 [Tenebrio molitor]|jgi:hypothetical protein|nr:hypothetical protein MTP99_003275 [Tenebrio molitor]CAH1379448.1 unnamed protein product [Tenebrio molitor]